MSLQEVKRQRLRTSSLLLSALVVAAFALSGITLYRTHADNCQSRNVALTVLHNFLHSADLNYQSNPLRTRAEKDHHHLFIAGQIRLVDQARC